MFFSLSLTAGPKHLHSAWLSVWLLNWTELPLGFQLTEGRNKEQGRICRGVEPNLGCIPVWLPHLSLAAHFSGHILH